MKSKLLLIITLMLILLPKIVFADIITPLSMMTIPLIPGIVLLEFIVFWIARKIIKFDAKLYILFVAVFVANTVTSILGTVFPLYKSAAENMMAVAAAFVMSVLIEWAVYELFFRKKIKVLPLFAVSLGGNIITYAFIMIFVL